MDMYKKASKLNLLFNTTSGNLHVNDLWNIPLSQLDRYAVELNNMIKQSATESFITPELPVDKIMQLRFDIAKDVVETRAAILEQQRKAAQTRDKNNKIRMAIANKKDEALREADLEDLEKMLEAEPEYTEED